MEQNTLETIEKQGKEDAAIKWLLKQKQYIALLELILPERSSD